MLDRLRSWARRLKTQALTAWWAARDPRTPWAVRVLAFAVAAYAFSPVDLIPDAIPVLGLLDDLLIVPLGVALVIRMTPAHVLADARRRAEETATRPVSRGMAAVVVAIWLAASLALALWAMRRVSGTG